MASLEKMVPRFRWLIGLAALAGLTSCVPAQTGQPIRIDGSSTVYPISKAIVESFRASTQDPTQISVNFSGTGGGFKKLCAKEIDIAGASRPITAKEMAVCDQAGVRYIEVPVAYDALTIVVNPQNTWAKDITPADLKKMWEVAAEGKVKNWNQIRPSYPNQPLRLFGPGKDSGTYDYFNEVVLGDDAKSRADYVQSEDDETIAQGVAQDVNALGYFGLAYFAEHTDTLKAIPVDNGQGSFVMPTAESVKKAQYQPFSRPLFIYVNARSKQENPAIRKLVAFYLKNAPEVVDDVGYVPLPAEGYFLSERRFNEGSVGTVFEGKPQPNLTMRQLLTRQAVYESADASTPAQPQ